MPSQSPDHWDALIAVGGVAVGAFLSLGATMFAAWRERKHQRRERLLAKLDELTAETQKLTDWLSEIHKADTIWRMQELHPSRVCYRVEALANLYFPALVPAVLRYTETLRSYHTWAVQMVPSFSADTTLPSAMFACLHKQDKTSMESRMAEIENRHREFARAVVDEAKRLLGS